MSFALVILMGFTSSGFEAKAESQTDSSPGNETAVPKVNASEAFAYALSLFHKQQFQNASEAFETALDLKPD